MFPRSRCRVRSSHCTTEMTCASCDLVQNDRSWKASCSAWLCATKRTLFLISCNITPAVIMTLYACLFVPAFFLLSFLYFSLHSFLFPVLAYLYYFHSFVLPPFLSFLFYVSFSQPYGASWCSRWHIREVPISNFGRGTNYMTHDFRGFPQFL